MVLDELSSWTIQNLPNLIGGVITSDTSAIVWTDHGDLLLYKRGAQEPVSLGTGPLLPVIPGDALPADVLYGVSPPGGAVFRIHSSGRVEPAAMRCPDLGDAKFLMQTDAGLLAIRAHPDGLRVSVSQSIDAECANRTDASIRCEYSSPTLIPSQGGMIMVACPDPTRPLLRIVLSGSTVALAEVKASVPHLPRLPTSDTMEAKWIGLPVVPIDGGFMRVIADLRSHMRRFEFWDYSGRHMKTSFVEQPIGFVSSLPSRRVLLGMRGTPALELVLYSWKWLPADVQ